jgi:polysaccharide pyruvyl transferase WcaK-like protein
MNDFTNRLSTLFTAYANYLGRFPDEEGFKGHFASSCPTEDLPDRIMRSDECRHVDSAVNAMKQRLEPFARHKRVLIFGAFGNGNLGDRIMARTVADYLEATSGSICFAYSQLQSASYSFASDRQLKTCDMPLNPRVMALFDVMVIGGGGLLSYTHEPLWDPAWPYTVPIPYGLLGCGVKVPLDERVDNLVRRAAVASARDAPGFAELANRRVDALLCPDPVLSLSPRADARQLPSKACLYVLRAPFCDWHRELKGRIGARDAVAIFEAHMDHEITSWFDDVHSINSREEFSRLASDFEVIVSERYHGAILALLAGVPVFGICRDDHADKLISLFDELGIAERCMAIANAPENFMTYEAPQVMAHLASIRAVAGISYREFLNRLFEAQQHASIAGPYNVLEAQTAIKASLQWSLGPPHIAVADRVNNITARLKSMQQVQKEASSSLEESQVKLKFARDRTGS